MGVYRSREASLAGQEIYFGLLFSLDELLQSIERVTQAEVRVIALPRPGVPTRLSDYGVARETVAEIPGRMERRGTVLGERADITPQVVSKIVDLCA
jgi:alcohol dehydrogenase YqhD (iron-dependent ADH family)